MKKKVARVFKRLKENRAFEIHVVPVNSNIFERMKALINVLSEDYREIAKRKLEYATKYLEQELYIPYEYENIIGVCLPKRELSVDFREGMKDRGLEVVENFFNGLGYELDDGLDWSAKYERQEQEVFQNLSELLVERLSEDELYYYQAEQFLQYIPHHKQDVFSSASLDNLLSTKIRALFGGGLELSVDGQESFVSYLPIGDVGITLDHIHLSEIARHLPFPVRLVTQCEFAQTRGQMALSGRVGRARTRSKNIMLEAYEAGSKQKRKIIQGQLALDDLEQKIDDDEPILDWFSCLVVFGRDKKEMRARKKYLLNRLDSLKIELVRATFDNPYLFQKCLLGNFARPQKKMKFWQHTSTVRAFAEMNFFTGLKSGTPQGFYFGRVDETLAEKESRNQIIHSSRNLIWLDSQLGNKQDIKGKKTNNPHILITGDTGSGKSVCGKKLWLESSLQVGKTLYIDPKREVRERMMNTISSVGFQQNFPDDVAFVESINFVTLDVRKEQNLGVLDPIVIFEKVQAKTIALSILKECYTGKLERYDDNAINEALDNVIEERENGKEVGFWQVIELLESNPKEEIAELGKLYRSRVKNTNLGLCFSHGLVRGLTFDDKVTVLEIANLDLPKEKNQSMDDSQRLSVAVMLALGAYCAEFGKRNPKEETTIFFDEAWLFQSSEQGRQVLKMMKRVGRSENNRLVLITQSVNDVENDDDGTGFGMIIAFDEQQNREGVLKYLDLPINEVNLSWIANMTQGQCLIKDVFNQVNRCVVHVIYQGWLELFKTVEDTEMSKLQKQAG